MRWILPTLVLMGCSLVNDDKFKEVTDVDNDGFIALRFGGPDCQDDNPDVHDCDADRDGFIDAKAGGEDCDDGDARINPDADELCDPVDHNCDGRDYEGAINPSTFYIDSDGDGHGNEQGLEADACGVGLNGVDAPSGLSHVKDDCDDADITIYPGAVEHCDSVDSDCDGNLDEGVGAVELRADSDEDGFGAGASLGIHCPVKGMVRFDNSPDSIDCDDSDPLANPFMPEIYYDGVDQNCNGMADEYDQDGDGFTTNSTTQPDCDDLNDDINANGIEVCDGVDNDCDGGIDNGVGQVYYEDADLDGRGSLEVTRLACGLPPEGWVGVSNDCDDSDASIYFGAPEVFYDGIDQNCSLLDDIHDDDDQDGDGYNNDVDCDDLDDSVHPGVTVDACDGVDNDCDGLIDVEDIDDVPVGQISTFYLDRDLDAFGDDTTARTFCRNEVEVGYVPDGGDCNDLNSLINPMADEVPYNGVDERCNGDADEWDQDGDGVGINEGDCDDNDYLRFPGAGERCDGIDSDCDGLTDDEDEDVPFEEKGDFFLDLDHDGFGDDLSIYRACLSAPPIGYITVSGDCDDNLSSVHPGADEVCDGVDNDCNTAVDDATEGLVLQYRDADGDNFGAESLFAELCPGAPGYVGTFGDCDDSQSTIYPGAPEVCGDGVAQDCNTPEAATDCDADGFVDVSFGGDDCNDDAVGVYPGADEICDGIDNNCSGAIDSDDPLVDSSTTTTYYTDADGDGYGDMSSILAMNSCDPIPGAVANGADCNDMNDSIYPGALEYCNGVDDDCDLVADDLPVVDPVTYFEDFDHDGLGNPLIINSDSCEPPTPTGWVLVSGDCNDSDDGVQVLRWYRDDDGDGYGQAGAFVDDCAQPPGYTAVSGDCDDSRDDRYPNNDEICDGLDNDCDGLIDSDDDDVLDAHWYADADGDGFGDAASLILSCVAIPGAVDNAADCNDSQAFINPDADERCDAVDNDCDGQVDDADVSVIDRPVWFADSDGDGLGDPSDFIASCVAPPSYTNNSFDCDDSDISVTNNTYYIDNDGDGYGQNDGISACSQPLGYATIDGDCDDNSALRSPAEVELCGDSLDNDCDGLIDADDPSSDAIPVYRDADGDSYGDPALVSMACSVEAGFSDNDLDCNDTNTSQNPSAVEACDSFDNDCDGLVDDADDSLVGGTAYYVDADGDGLGDDLSLTMSCGVIGGAVLVGGDCDDSDASLPTNWYIDNDGDSFGQNAGVVFDCVQPPSTVLINNDCDDAQPLANPSEPEVCDGFDNDCDGLVDIADPDLSTTIWYRDLDGDGQGDPTDFVESCTGPAGYVTNHDDCDDLEDTVYVGAAERCDGIDNDCDGDIDDADTVLVDAPVWYPDADLDGYGDMDPATRIYSCSEPVAVVTYVSVGQDCDDTEPLNNPGLAESCDGIDNDCDGDIDDADSDVGGTAQWFFDADDDGYGDPGNPSPVLTCSQPADIGGHSFVSNNDDCADADALIFPSGVEVCDGQDNDCDGLIDNGVDPTDLLTWYKDADSDGFGSAMVLDQVQACSQPPGFVYNAEDCNDADASISPAAVVELCDSVDNDCDTLIDDADPDLSGAPQWFFDADDDGYGDPGTPSITACLQPAPALGHSYRSNDDDCSDATAAAYPGAMEICDGIDNDCDGVVDIGATDEVDWHLDADGDGYGTNLATSPTISSCDQPPGYVFSDTDCDDGDASVSPGAIYEFCDGVDNDCDGFEDALDLDSPGDAEEYFPDADGDGFSEFIDGKLFCDPSERSPAEVTAGYRGVSPYEPEDCDDGDGSVHPGALEICGNPVDEDCSGFLNDAPTAIYYNDVDGDGYFGGAPATFCEGQPDAGYVQIDPADFWFDCKDGNDNIHPDGIEICGNTDDEDCSGDIDDGDYVIDGFDTWIDRDLDGFRGGPPSGRICDVGLVQSDEGDCDDFLSSVHPGADEVCDGFDNDCDEMADNPLMSNLFGDRTEVFEDEDGDLYRGYPTSFFVCDTAGYLLVGDALPGEDCVDYDPSIHPGATEYCYDGQDSDCDFDDSTGNLDPADPMVYQYTYKDDDDDGVGDEDLAYAYLTCYYDMYALLPEDCDDSDPTVAPGADEICDGIDNNCDGLTDDDDPGLSTNGWGPSGSDSDFDNHVDPGTATIFNCADPGVGYLPADDCQEGNAAYHPGAVDVCDEDRDCDGAAYYSGGYYFVGSEPEFFSTVSEALATGCDNLTLAVEEGFTFVDSTVVLGTSLTVEPQFYGGAYTWVQGATGPVITSSSGSVVVTGGTFQKSNSAHPLLFVDSTASLSFEHSFLNAAGFPQGGADAQLGYVKGSLYLQDSVVDATAGTAGLAFNIDGGYISQSNTEMFGFGTLAEVTNGGTVGLTEALLHSGGDGIVLQDIGSTMAMNGSRFVDVGTAIDASDGALVEITNSIFSGTDGIRFEHNPVYGGVGTFSMLHSRVVDTHSGSTGVIVAGGGGVHTFENNVIIGGQIGVRTNTGMVVKNSVFYGMDTAFEDFNATVNARVDHSLILNVTHCASGGGTGYPVANQVWSDNGSCSADFATFVNGTESYVFAEADFLTVDVATPAITWNFYPDDLGSSVFVDAGDPGWDYDGTNGDIGLSGGQNILFYPISEYYTDVNAPYGVEDGWEHFWFGTTWGRDVTVDSDGDGISDENEMHNYTDPLDPTSF